jgi:hypothetical protein
MSPLAVHGVNRRRFSLALQEFRLDLDNMLLR